MLLLNPDTSDTDAQCAIEIGFNCLMHIVFTIVMFELDSAIVEENINKLVFANDVGMKVANAVQVIDIEFAVTYLDVAGWIDLQL